MAKLLRKNQKVFGSSAGLNQIGEFGSLAAGSPAFTTDPETVQALANYLTGWFGAVIGGNSPAIEDMNALCFLFAYQLSYLMQTGVPEWNASTTYFIGSLVNDGSGALYYSLTNNNTNNALTSSSNWALATQKETVKRLVFADSPYTISPSDQHLEFDCTGGNIVATLPSRALYAGRTLKVDRADLSANTLTLNRAGGDVIADQTLTDTSYVMDVGLQSEDFFAGTTFWKVRG